MKKGLKSKQGPAAIILTILLLIANIVGLIWIIAMWDVMSKVMADGPMELNFIDKLFFNAEHLEKILSVEDSVLRYTFWDEYWHEKMDFIFNMMFVVVPIMFASIASVIPFAKQIIVMDDSVRVKNAFGIKTDIGSNDIISVTKASDSSFIVVTSNKTYKFRSVRNADEICKAVMKLIEKKGNNQNG